MKIVKKISFMLLLLSISFACSTNTTSDSTSPTENEVNIVQTVGNESIAEPVSTLPLTSVEFFEDSHNFGEVVEGDTVRHVYKFRNTGTNPLKISSVKPSCGCTVPTYSDGEIAPGAEGLINVAFASNGKSGIQKKSVNVTFENTDPKVKILSFNCEVVANN